MYVHTSASVCVVVSWTEQMLYSSGDVSSGADEGLKVRLSVSEAHRAQLLQLLLELLAVDLRGHQSSLKSYLLQEHDQELVNRSFASGEWKHGIQFDKSVSHVSLLIFSSCGPTGNGWDGVLINGRNLLRKGQLTQIDMQV